MGGHFQDREGSTVIWNVAAGARGRRWRWIRTGPTAATVSVLLETGPTGRPTRLEVTSAAGLLVLHPEPDGNSAHGNVVGPNGVRPLALAWSRDHLFDVAELPWVAVACLAPPARSQGAYRAGTHAGAGRASEPIARPVLLIRTDLRVSAEIRSVRSTPDGLPLDGARWLLE